MRASRPFAQSCQLLSDVTLTNTAGHGRERHGLGSGVSLRSDVTLTDTEVTDECVTAFAQHCQLLPDVTLTNTVGHG